MLKLISKLFGTGNSDELKQIINDNAFLVDVRTPEEYKAGHVQGSVNIPLHSISNNLKKFKDKKHIVVFCRSGMRSSQAKSILEQNGFKNVINGGTWNKINQIKTQL
jgi:rhodanese-related sulfurtransferase